MVKIYPDMLNSLFCPFLVALQEQLSAYENAGGRAQKFLKLTERHAAFTELTPAILNEFISRIEVHERDKKRAKQAIISHVHNLLCVHVCVIYT
ncbi:DUF4368 domain-containing protein [Faecalibacterium prausnitzii]|uniref:DUF4368 domain-containing protein n=1 Tax=Faecalibacterium prausnitzii TaxID=853 RepID=UPI003F1CC211